MRIHGTVCEGEKRAVKLSAEKALAIRAMIGTQPQRIIAEKFGVSQSVVSNISTGALWKSATLMKQEESA